MESTGATVVRPLPHGYSFVETNSLMHMLAARGLFIGLPLEDQYAGMTKLTSVCISSVG